MTLKVGDKHKGWTVSETSPSGSIVLHQSCEACGCPTGTEWRTTEARLSQRSTVVKSHSCIKYIRKRLDALESRVAGS